MALSPPGLPLLPRGARPALTAAAAVLLAACAPLPSLDAPQRLDSTQSMASNQSLRAADPDKAAVQWPRETWWRSYGDPQLDQLIDEALSGAPDLAAATARMAQAQYAVGGARAVRRPQVDAQASVSEQRLSYNDIIPGDFVPQDWNDYGSIGLHAGWDLDFFGRNRALLKAALASGIAAEAQLAQARLTLTTSIAGAYAGLSSLYASRDVAEQSVAVQQHSVELFQQRFDHGLETIGAVHAAQARCASAQFRLQQLDERIGLQQHAIAALLGAGPDRGLAIQRPQLRLDRDFGLPDQLAVNLLGRRPDIVAARAEVEAAASRVDASRAAFYPDVNLSAAIGFESLGLDMLAKHDSLTGSVGPAISLPIFHGGALRARLKGAAAAYDQSVALYNGTLSHALQDVADVALSQRALGGELDQLEAAWQAAEASYRVAEDRYRAQLASYLDVLTAQDTMLAAQDALTTARARSLTLDIDLHRALGGGWQIAQN